MFMIKILNKTVTRVLSLSGMVILLFLTVFMFFSSSCSRQGSESVILTSPSPSSSTKNTDKYSGSLKAKEKLKTGEEELRNNRFEEAVKIFSEVIEMEPDNYDAYDLRSMTYYNMGEHEKGVADCSKAIMIAKKTGIYEVRCPRGTLARRGAHYFNLNETDKAIQDFREVIKYAPDFAFAYYDLGQSYFKKGEYEKASEYFQKAVTLNEDEGITKSAKIKLEKINEIRKGKIQ